MADTTMGSYISEGHSLLVLLELFPADITTTTSSEIAFPIIS